MTKSSSKFQHDNPFTNAVEEEYMLCDPSTGELVHKAEEIMSKIPSELINRFS